MEWNYNSNRIEGNTLTFQETALLIMFGRYDGGHEERHYTEMKAHDMAITQIKEWAEDKKRRLTESDIRGLNKLILKESFWSPAQTLDGMRNEKRNYSRPI